MQIGANETINGDQKPLRIHFCFEMLDVADVEIWDWEAQGEG
jgi:hypothetical protein